MRKLVNFFASVLLCSLFISGSEVAAQSTENVNPSITEAYGSYVPNITPKQMIWLNSQLSRSEVKKSAPQAGEQLPLLSSVPLMQKFVPGLQRDDFTHQPLKINPLKYMINFMLDDDQTFRIDGTDYVLFVKGLK